MASSSGDLKTYTTSSIDFYAFLDLPPNFTQKELDRSWRKTAFKYHPDKAGASDATAREKFHLANIAYEVFSDPSTRQLYDNAREARERRRKQEELLQGKRRQLKADLEARERAATSGVKLGETARGAKDEVLDEEERLEREVRRIAEDGRRRRLEREEALRRQMREEEEVLERRKKEEEEQAKPKATPERQGDWSLGRSVKIKFIRTSQSEALEAPVLQAMFSTFGAVEDVVLLEDKRQRLGGSKAKTTMGRALIVFKSTEGAYSAVEDWVNEKISKGGPWSVFEDVFWAEGKEPEYLANKSKAPPASSTPKHKISNFLSNEQPNFKQGQGTPGDTGDFMKTPSLETSSEAAKPPTDLQKLEESTMLRLRRAEERRLEANKSAKYRLPANVMVA